MKKTPQNPQWHAEGDVWSHTKLVLEALVADEEYQALPREKQELVFLAALMHDMGKPACTVLENGVWRSPKHTIVGAGLARELLWRECGLCGTPRAQQQREALCALIRYHSQPMYLLEKPEPERVFIKMAAMGAVAPDFSLSLLRILMRADIKGRIAPDNAQKLESLELSFLMARELNILEAPYHFPDPVTAHAYLSGKDVARDFPLYDSTWPEVVLMVGLPGTGKDTWLKQAHPDLPVISLDDIRQELGIPPTDREGQGTVVATAKERARGYLRQKQPFAWNATNITAQLRRTLLSLFAQYGAKTRVVYLETTLETEYQRNKSRPAAVPEAVIDRMLSKLEPPTPDEAHIVEWITV